MSAGRTAVNRESHSPERPSVTPNARAWESPRGWALSLALISTVAVAARAAYVLWVLGPVRSGLDAIWYQLQGGSILAGTGYVVPTSLFEGELTPTAAFPPVYPAYQALWQWMFGPGATAVRMAGVVPGVVTVVLVAILGRALADARVGLLAAGAVALSPTLVAADSSTMSENLTVPLVLAALVLAHRVLTKGIGWTSVIALGAVCGVAVLTRQDLALIVVLVALPAVLASAGTGMRARLSAAALVVLVVVAVVGPWMWRNHRAVGTYAVSTISPSSALAGSNCDATFGGPDPAKWAGGPLKDKPRKIAMIAAEGTEQNDAPIEMFTSILAEDYGAELANIQRYDDPLALGTTGRAMLSQFKSEGITSIVFVGDPIAPQTLTRIASEQDYHPEWITSGSSLVENNVFSRTYDQDQWARAFGPTSLFPRVDGGIGTPIGLHKWYFGTEPPGGAAALLTVPNLQVLFGGLQGAGPDLTAEHFRDALFTAPILAGSPIAPQISFGNRGFFPNTDYVALDDMTEISWDPDVIAPDEGGKEGKGGWRYSDGGKRYLPGEWPDDEPHVFDAETGVTNFEEFPTTAEEPPADWAPVAGPRKGKTYP